MVNNLLTIEYFRGCLLGGAVGDALGAPIEFQSLESIMREFGKNGVRDYVEFHDKIGKITDDTQMALFTAEGLLRAFHRGLLRGIRGAEVQLTFQAYLRWLSTQQPTAVVIPTRDGWLLQQKELYEIRVPGNTCLTALYSGKCGTIENPINESKGCGAVMRMALVGLMYREDHAHAFDMGCRLAAITHGHPSGYLSAGFLAGMIAAVVQGAPLLQAILTNMDTLKNYDGHEETLEAIDHAIDLSRKNQEVDFTITEQLGGGWVAEEALAIAVYCSLCHEQDFEQGVIRAINHSGDSDSTGAITGNILGTLLGESFIPASWIKNLKCRKIIEEMAEDVFIKYKGYTDEPDEVWLKKYPLTFG